MKRRDFLNVTAAVAGAAMAGCTDFADSADFDAGSSEAGTSPDSSAGEDAGGGEDSGPEMDAGPAPEDAGPEMDAGPGEMDAGADAGPMAMCVSISFTVGTDHDGALHADGITFPAEHVTMGVEQTYDITGAGTHGHNIVVSPENFTSLAAGESVTIESDGGGHTHSVTLQCMS